MATEDKPIPMEKGFFVDFRLSGRHKLLDGNSPDVWLRNAEETWFQSTLC
jgi:hypothetical protein